MTTEQLLAAVETDAQAYLATRTEATMTVGLTVGGERHLRTFRSPDATLAPLPKDDSIYEIGSISKTFTLSLFAVLEAEGVLSLEDHVAQHLPDLDLSPEIAALTLRDLATHSSGLPSVGPRHQLLILEELHGTSAPPFGAYTHYLRYRKEDLYADLEAVRLDYPTGTGWAYSIIGMGTLGHILELATGTPYEQLLKEKLCGPLGLPETGYTLSFEQLDRMVRAYDSEGQPLQNWRHDVLLPQGGLRSTVTDLLGFAEAHLRSGTAGAPLGDALTRTRQPHYRVSSSALAVPPSPPWTDAVVHGLAWRGIERPGGLAWWHPGTTLFYHCCLALDEQTGTGLAMLTSDRGTLLQMPALNDFFLTWFGNVLA